MFSWRLCKVSKVLSSLKMFTRKTSIREGCFLLKKKSSFKERQPVVRIHHKGPEQERDPRSPSCSEQGDPVGLGVISVDWGRSRATLGMKISGAHVCRWSGLGPWGLVGGA